MEVHTDTNTSAREMTVVSDQGSGRPFVVVFDEPAYTQLAAGIGRELATLNRAIVLESVRVSADNWSTLSEVLVSIVRNLGVRQASFVCFASAATLVQNAALEEPKLVRSLVMVDATSRPHPSRWERMVDRIEN